MKIFPLLSTWVKRPDLRDNVIVIVSECIVNFKPDLMKTVAEDDSIVLYACPEREHDTYHGKIATMLKCARPRKVIVLTVDGSPHCLLLHAAVETARFITGLAVDVEHYVVVNMSDVVKIDVEAVRVARYLHLVQELVRKSPEIVERLRELSIEHREL